MVDLAEHFLFLFNDLFQGAVGGKHLQHADVFAEPAFVFGGELVQALQDAVHDFTFGPSLDVTQDGEHQGVRVVLGEQGLAVDRVHVDDAVAVAQARLLDAVGHAKRGFANVNEVLTDIDVGVRLQDVAAIAKHARRHPGFVVVLNIDVQDEVAVFALHVSDQIGAAVFDALVFGFDDFGVVNLEVLQYLGDIDGDTLENIFGDDVISTMDWVGSGAADVA